jgi:aminopeptidase N
MPCGQNNGNHASVHLLAILSMVTPNTNKNVLLATMVTKKTFILLAFLFCIFPYTATSQTENEGPKLNVLDYRTNLEVDVEERYIRGDVTINFLLNTNTHEVIFSSGGLQITGVIGESVESYMQQDKKLIIKLISRATNENRVQIFYNGKPSRGFVIPEPGQAHTVYFTSEWMVCNDSPNDKAKFAIDLLIPSEKICIASGTLVKKDLKGEKVLYSWSQDYEMPTYTYGFVIGSFNKFEARHREIALNYYSKNHTSSELEVIFSKTRDMIHFFEERSGISYAQNSYSQILIGNHYQEMSGFAVLNDSYGKLVLRDSTETNLISHELAHQWWGNLITCESWNHFWLNEGFATFMSAAYNEHRFGDEKYNSDVDSYFKVYKAIRDGGKDKPLVFNSWSNATKDDRNLVYFKGAYVLHLLRLELGEQKFWYGIKSFSQEYFGKSVNTFQFQKSMEKASGQNLNKFFNKWIYGSGITN